MERGDGSMCDSCDYHNLLERIQDLFDSGRADWASDTLEGIHDWVEEHEHVTDAQRRAVENIGEKAGR